MGVGTVEGDSDDYTVDLNRLVNKSKDNEDIPAGGTDSFSHSHSFSGSRRESSKRLSSNFSPPSSGTNRSSTSSRYRDSLNNAEVKDIQAIRNANNHSRISPTRSSYTGNNSSTSAGWLSYYFCSCFVGESERKTAGEGVGDTKSFTDPLLH